jgi:sulfite reductase (NADPH) flavoprotein alpha-component
MKAPYIPEDAPFSGDQRAWLGGFLAGLHSRAVMGGNAAPVESSVQAKPIHILFGTQTGNAEEVANEAATLARTRGFAPKVEELDAISAEQLATMEHVIVVVSTYGEGEMPDNAALFWEALSSPTAPRLEGMKYGVLGLGDTSYDQFCQAAKLIDMRLEQLGATRLGDRVDCDVDYEEVATAWLGATLPTAENATAPVPAREGAKLTKSGWSRKHPYIVQSDRQSCAFRPQLGQGNPPYRL